MILIWKYSYFKRKLIYLKKGYKNGIGFVEFTKQLIKERELNGKRSDYYENTISVVKRYISPAEDIFINDITNEWLKKFDLFMVSLNYKDSSIESYTIAVKTIYFEAQSRETLNIKKGNPFSKPRQYKWIKKFVDFNIDDMVKLINIKDEDIKTKSKYGIEKIRLIIDLFIFQFCIGGHDFVDIALLTWNKIKDNRIIFNRFKNRYRKMDPVVNNFLNQFALNV